MVFLSCLFLPALLFDTYRFLFFLRSFQTKSVFTIGLFTNKPFLFSVTGSIVAQMLVIYWAPLQRVFVTEPLSLGDILSLLAISSTVFVASEIKKFFERRAMWREKQVEVYQGYDFV